MADFTSEFWSWFIIVLTVGSLLGCVWLVIWQLEAKKPKGEAPKPMGHVWDEDLQELNNPMPGWWLNLFYATFIFAAVYLVLYPGLGTWKGTLGWSSASGENSMYNKEMAKAKETYGPLYDGYLKQDIAALAKDPEAMKTATRLFQNYCTVCHGSDAGGNPGGFPNLTDNDWLYGGSPDQIKQTIMSGRMGMMPSWKHLGDESIANVAAYVMSLSGAKADGGDAAKGAEVFKANCVACHGADAKGNQAMGAPNLTDKIWLHGGSASAVVQTIANGRRGIMPPHDKFLGEAKVHLLAAYIYGLSNK